MGTFEWPLRLETMDGRGSLKLEALVDTGSTFTVVAADRLRELGVSPFEKVHLELADGRRDFYDIGRAMATIDGRTEATLVVFGDEGAPALLGAYTLEGLRLQVDPVHRQLVPLRGRA